MTDKPKRIKCKSKFVGIKKLKPKSITEDDHIVDLDIKKQENNDI